METRWLMSMRVMVKWISRALIMEINVPFGSPVWGCDVQTEPDISTKLFIPVRLFIFSSAVSHALSSCLGSTPTRIPCKCSSHYAFYSSLWSMSFAQRGVCQCWWETVHSWNMVAWEQALELGAGLRVPYGLCDCGHFCHTINSLPNTPLSPSVETCH